MIQRPPTSVSTSSTQEEILGPLCIFSSPVSPGHIGVSYNETKKIRVGLMSSSIGCYYCTVNNGATAALYTALMFTSLGEGAITATQNDGNSRNLTL